MYKSIGDDWVDQGTGHVFLQYADEKMRLEVRNETDGGLVSCVCWLHHMDLCMLCDNRLTCLGGMLLESTINDCNNYDLQAVGSAVRPRWDADHMWNRAH